MSKRKKKPTPLNLSAHGVVLRRFQAANERIHTINVSEPILLIVQRLVKDPSFREDVMKRYAKL